MGKYTDKELFCKNEISPSCVKRRYRDLYINPICSIEQCGIGCMYNEIPFTMHIDHIDGDCKNHDLLNLRYLCPNCHSQSSTFRFKNVKKKNKPIHQ